MVGSRMQGLDVKSSLARLGRAAEWGLRSIVSLPGLRQATEQESRTRAGYEAAAVHQAQHDGLTDLPNRSLLRIRLEDAFLDQRQHGSDLALLLLDLDRFKEVNDTLGHRVGDTLLQQIGRRLQAALQTTDLVARLGGDEFAVLLVGADIARATQVADELVAVLHTPFVLEGQPVAVDASIGIAIAPEHGQDPDTLLRCADVAMYQAKESGAGPSIYRPDQDRHSPDRLVLLGELRSAIDQDALLLHYQPKLDMRDGSLVGVEALVRWQHPFRGFLSPGEFVPLAERTGLIYPLTRWVLEAALKQQLAWRGMGFNVPMAVNLSRRLLHDSTLPETVAQLLARWDVEPGSLMLEITESSLMADPQRTSENLTQLRALGVRMSIDDFGTGYSSLASLQNLSVDELKIDKSFVQAMATDASARAIVRAIVDLADALKLRVVAEGIEDSATWDVLARLGCDVAQGYLLSPPIVAAEFEAWLEQVGPSWVKVAERSRVKDVLQERIRGRGARLTAEEEFVARKQAEAALGASEERNRVALQAAGMGTWDSDLLHGVQTWSVETEALLGLAPGTIDGDFEVYRSAIHPDDWASLHAEWQAALSERRDFSATYRTLWPDGTVHWIEDNGRGMYADDGAPVRMTGTSMNINDRKQAEEALRTSEERFRKQYKGMPLPTYSWLQVDDDFVLQDYNDAADAFTGGGVRSWLGTRASEHYADQLETLETLHACVAEQRTLRREQQYAYGKAGRERHLAVTYVFVPPQTVMLHIEDVTEARQAEKQREAMAQSEKLRALGQMATGIAHELNQSLMLVASYSELARQALVQSPPSLSELEDLLTTTTQAALDGGETVKRLLLFTRAAPEHDNQVVDLNRVVREAAQLTAPRWRDAAQAEGRRISLLVEADGHPTVQGSPGRLCELMTNLIFNAVEALPHGGTIRLRVRADQGHGIVEVSDSGLGMTAEVLAHVFEPFFTTKGEGGTGLGLAMVFGIVEQHGGQIQVHSVPGNGTSFRMAFPLLDESATSALLAAPSAPSELLRPLRVLAVDDEPMMTKAVARMLKPAGHLVSVAMSGEEALERLAEQTFDVVVSDMGMGAGMTGWELAEIVRTRWPNVRFLLATGWGAAVDPLEARSRGVQAVLSKPYRPIDLVQALTTLAAAA